MTDAAPACVLWRAPQRPKGPHGQPLTLISAKRGKMRIGDRLAKVELRTATGEAVEVGTMLDRVLLIQCLRYYG